MSKNLIIGTVLLSIVILVAAAFFISNSSKIQTETPLVDSQSVENSSENNDISDTDVNDTSEGVRYVEYSQQKFENSKDKKRVYFFHASWCPTCKVANEEFSSNPTGIPEDVVLFKTNYDLSSDLKKKFGITYQHTFVQVDENGDEIAKWNGGGIAELSANVR